MFTVIKWVKGNPYKYLLKSVWDKKKKTPRMVFVAYQGPATEEDIKRHYKGEKYGNKNG